MQHTIPCIYIDYNSKKTEIIEKIKDYHNLSSSVYIIPKDEKAINLCFFVADVFRRSGNFVNCIPCDTNEGMFIYICNFKNTSIEKQITCDHNISTLKKNIIHTNVGFLTLRACGMACCTMFKYATHLVKSGDWEYASNININAIPVKIKTKNIFKTTVQIKLQRKIYTDDGI